MKAKQALLAALLLATVVFCPSNLPSCGPFFAVAIFTQTGQPPAPISDYARGRLGVLQSNYRQDYLVVAYRYLSGKPLSATEQKAIELPMWGAYERSTVVRGETSEPAVQAWLDARAKVPGAGEPQPIETYRSTQSPSWEKFLNCSDDSFRNARETVEARIGAFGPGHPGIKGWVSAQDSVFANCSDGNPSIPAPPEHTLPQALKHDREYQIAAAHFYAMHYDEAAKLFRAIEAEKESSWSHMAPYLVARCLIRKAVVPGAEGKFDSGAFSQAEEELTSILHDPDRKDLHPMALKLENYVALHIHPLEYLRTAASRLQDSANADDFKQNLVDYRYVLERSAPFHFTMDNARQTSDLSDWVLTWGGGKPAYAYERWQATGSVAWLLSAISKIERGDPESADLLAAALKIAKDSPAYPTAQYHRIRLLSASGKRDEARTVLDEILPGLRTSLDRSSLNMFLAYRMSLARNLDEFLQFAPRFPVDIQFGDKDIPLPLLDSDSTEVLDEELPLSMLQRAMNIKSLAVHLRRQLSRMVWTRAVLIAADAVAGEAAAVLEQNFPELRPDLRTWHDAADADSRQFAAALLMLHFPGMSPFISSGVPRRKYLAGIHDYGENWWCGFSTTGALEEPTGDRRSGSRYEPKVETRPEPSTSPSFLSDAKTAEARSEWQKLATMETAPDYFGRIVLAYAAKHPGDARVPEALHLVVKSTRYGCNDADSGRYSQSAFALLHGKYENTQWAKMTPFWFK
ncbi:MAG: hypothetical protein ABSH28_12595 [Acidobacteriota bacterium]